MKTFLTILVSVVGLLAVNTASADLIVHIDYAEMSVVYTPGGILSITDTTASNAKARIDDSGTTTDRTDIGNSTLGAGTFDLDLTGTIVNPAGLDNLQWTGAQLKATDTLTTLAAPSLLADVANVAQGLDLDGISYSGPVLSIRGRLSTVGANPSILVNPAGPGAWTYLGEDDAPIGPGADGVADQITVNSPARDGYDYGTLVLFEIQLSKYADGTTITAANADELFAGAELHGGFATTGGDLKVDIIPAPGAMLLGALGLGLIGWARRRYS